MTPMESLKLTRIVRSACPSQKFDEYTPDVWHKLLEDLDFDDCLAAVVALGQRQTFMSPAEIRAQIITARRVAADLTRSEGVVRAIESAKSQAAPSREGYLAARAAVDEALRAKRAARGETEDEPQEAS